MSDNIRRASLQLLGETREFQLVRPSARAYAVLEELSFMRREAQLEAVQAYEDWCHAPTSENWTVYVAAQDRADAAQDNLADYARRLAA